MTDPINDENVEQPQDEKAKNTTQTITEELEIAGNQLVARVQELIREGNVRRLIIKNSEGEVLMDTTLTFGALAGAVAIIAGPLAAAVAGIAAVVARVQVEIVREVDGEEAAERKTRIEISDDES